MGLGSEGERCPLPAALTCPYEMDAMAPAVYRPTPGSSFCSSSAVLGILPASSDTTWQGRGQAQGSSWAGHVKGTHFAHGKMGSQSLQPCASSTASARQGRHEPAPAQQPQRALEMPLLPTPAPSLLLPADASLWSSSQVQPTAHSPPAPRDTAGC